MLCNPIIYPKTKISNIKHRMINIEVIFQWIKAKKHRIAPVLFGF